LIGGHIYLVCTCTASGCFYSRRFCNTKTLHLDAHLRPFKANTSSTQHSPSIPNQSRINIFLMASAIDAHLRDLESEAREAEREVDEFRERSYQRIEQLNQEVANIVLRVQTEKEDIKERISKKEEWARRKQDEVQKFKVCFLSRGTKFCMTDRFF
jgi:hypothetical protein